MVHARGLAAVNDDDLSLNVMFCHSRPTKEHAKEER